MKDQPSTLRGDPRARLHANAKLTPASRRLLIRRVREKGWPVKRAAEAAGVSKQTAHKWLRRFDDGGMGPSGNPPLQTQNADRPRYPRGYLGRSQPCRLRGAPVCSVVASLSRGVTRHANHAAE
ncbi:MAG: helix-turn-helix domain-containing protein [Deltaproteobacteria bacterium]|nr:helix-turn-helix domain-containing protein [Deltaproteobacteria bacterium]